MTRLRGPATAQTMSAPQVIPGLSAVADRYDAAIVREAHTVPLATHARRRCTLAFARRAARRVIQLNDPDALALPPG